MSPPSLTGRGCLDSLEERRRVDDEAHVPEDRRRIEMDRLGFSRVSRRIDWKRGVWKWDAQV